jgi:hypothetical protein
MANFAEFFEGDDRTLKYVFKIDGTAQSPDSATIKIVDTAGTVIIADATAVSRISTTVIEYDMTTLVAGNYKAYFTAVFGSEKATGELNYIVRKKDGLEI